MKKTWFVLLGLILIYSQTSIGQIGIGYYPFQSVFSINSNSEKLIWGDLRVETNTFFSNINFELDGMINIKRTSFANYYTGIGINISPFQGTEYLSNGYVFNFGTRIKPIRKHQQFQIMFEISPYFNPYFDGGKLRTLLGVSYYI